jgi:hypothetical protein
MTTPLDLAPFGGDTEPVEGVGTSPAGYNTEGDIVPRVTATADNVDLNVIWQQMAQALGEWNAHRSVIVDLLSYWHTSIADAVPQALVESLMEEATEFGEPVSAGPPPEHLLLGYDFKDYDRASKFTWRFLRDSDARQVRAVHDDALRSDNATVTTKIMQRLFTPAPTVNEQGIVCYGLWNGQDGITPPRILGKSFDATHTHYHATGADTVDSEDLEFAVKDIREHHYGMIDSGQELIALVNPTESEIIESFRAGVPNENDAVPKWDFIRALNQPAFVLQEQGQLVGEQPPGTIFNLPTVGKYGPVWIVETTFIPEHYFTVVATSGPGSHSNPIGVRQHANPQYQGLRQLAGNHQRYPLIESFYTRSFGTGVRHRSAATVFQVTSEDEHTVPTIIR